MDPQSGKLAFIQEFLKLSSEEGISKFEALLKRQKEEPEKDFEDGKFTSSEELLERFK
jgi:hypothetical protein